MVWSHIKAKSVARFLFYSRSHTVPAWSRLIMSILWCGMKYNQAGACIVNTKICCQNIVMWFCQYFWNSTNEQGLFFFYGILVTLGCQIQPATKLYVAHEGKSCVSIACFGQTVLTFINRCEILQDFLCYQSPLLNRWKNSWIEQWWNDPEKDP